MDKLDFIKIKNFCAENDTRKWKESPQNGRKNLHISTSDQGPVYRIYKEQLNYKKKKDKPNLKVSKGFE